MARMHLLQGRNNQTLNLHIRVALGQQARVQRPVLGHNTDLVLLPPAQGALVAGGGSGGSGHAGEADPLVGPARRHEDDLPLARGQQVADDEVVAVALEGRLSLVDEDVL